MATEDGLQPRQTIVVVGLGMVGIAFIQKILNLDGAQGYRIVTCGEEGLVAYNRVSLTDYFQHRNIEELYLESPDWYAKQDPERFTYHIGEKVVSLDPTAHTVTSDNGRVIAYDHCVLATGSDATLPAYADLSISGVFVYRNISDVNRIITYAEKPEMKDCSAVVLGGGLLGLEAAKAVHDLPTVKDVAIVHRQAFPLSRQLDAQGGAIVRARIEGMGVRFLGGTSVVRLVRARRPGSFSPPTDPAFSPNSRSECGEEEGDGGEETLAGVELADGTVVPCDMVVFAIGITPRDDVARAAGLACARGVVVDDALCTSAPDVYAIGECASWHGNTYGLIAPGIEMADILAFNFTQARTEVGSFKPRQMNTPDLSTKLKLMGVDVASFGDFFAEKHVQTTPQPKPTDASSTNTEGKHDASAPRKRHGAAAAAEGPVETLTYRDPFAGVYKKYIFSADGRYLLGGMMVGDTGDYVKLVAIVKKKKALDVPPSQFIVGSRGGGEDSAEDLDDDTQICSCHNISKGQVVQCVKDGAQSVADVKTRTKAGTGCGGCVPLLTSIVKAEMKKAGLAVNNNLCPHFAMSRADLFDVIRIKKLKTSAEIMATVGVNSESLGCETCKPAIGSILSSLYNEHIMAPAHLGNQDTNDRLLANIQRNGTFSVVPRVAAGEITPEKLVAIGSVAKKYGLYTKITGGQRIDMFGAEKADLPSIWKELVDAGFESGHAYGKALRTVKSCVGTSWCRYGIGDSVGMAVLLEQRYKGIRSPHKFKGGVSGCVRECAEAQGKDFGLIATDKGWNIFVCGNGGANPRHATLLAGDVPPSKVIRTLDRFIMYYIRTADKLMRTARWLEGMEGGIDKLRRVVLDDELGICEDLEKEMDELVGTYYDEWKAVVDNPELQKQFRQFVNTDQRVSQTEMIAERGQTRPANWSKKTPPLIIKQSDIGVDKTEWKWKKLATVQDLVPNDSGTTAAAVRYGDSQIAIFHVPHKGFFATQQMCPHRRAFVLDHGIVGDDPSSGALYVSCPMHKRNFDLTTGACLNDGDYGVIAFDVKREGDDLLLLLPEPDALDAVIGTSKWMVRQATAELIDKGAEETSAVEIVGPTEETGGCGGTSCGDSKLEW